MPGVAAVSPQLFLSTLVDAPCCSVSDMFMIAYDPETQRIYLVDRAPPAVVAIDMRLEDGIPRAESLWTVEACGGDPWLCGASCR